MQINNISNSQLIKLRRWYQQYRATHGTNPPASMLNDLYQGEVEANISKANESRRVGLYEKSININKDFNQQRLDLEMQRMDDAKDAARWKGAGDIANLSMEIGKNFNPFQGTKKTSPLDYTISNKSGSEVGLDFKTLRKSPLSGMSGSSSKLVGMGAVGKNALKGAATGWQIMGPVGAVFGGVIGVVKGLVENYGGGK